MASQESLNSFESIQDRLLKRSQQNEENETVEEAVGVDHIAKHDNQKLEPCVVDTDAAIAKVPAGDFDGHRD